MKVAFYTLGCKVNQYETEAMREKFMAAGFDVASEDAEGVAADIYVINTCTVTNLADRKSRQFIRRAKKLNPDAFVAVTGCYAQVDPDAVAKIDGVDLIAGTNEKQNIVEYVVEELNHRENQKKSKKQNSVLSNGIISEADNKLNNKTYSEINTVINVREYSELNDYCSDGLITAMESRTRAYVKIQEGCNRFCTYCIIPYARGQVRSRDEAEIIEEVRGLVDSGFKEIVLTGINTALYGAERSVLGSSSGSVSEGASEGAMNDNAAGPDSELATGNPFGLRNLLKKIDDIPGDFRVRLSSLEPTVVSKGDVESILDSKRLCPHLHLSIQSGSDNVLRAMNRRYTRSEYLEIVDMLRSRSKEFGNRKPDQSSQQTDDEFIATQDTDFGITTDIIVGFPGETEEDFRDTLDLVKTAGFSKVHVFRYSPRRGTQAAEMVNQVGAAEKGRRAAALIEAAEEAAKEFLLTQAGRHARVLVEEVVNQYYVGYTDNYIRAYIPAGEIEQVNGFVEVELLKPFQDGMLAQPV